LMMCKKRPGLWLPRVGAFHNYTFNTELLEPEGHKVNAERPPEALSDVKRYNALLPTRAMSLFSVQISVSLS
jgi:hypothetical protein